MLFSGTVMRTRVYVDGFNLYYGALKDTPFKWLDPVRLAQLLVPRGYSIDRVRYFTARVSGKADPTAPARQQIYLKALTTLPEVELHFGRFLAKTAWRPLVNLPVAGDRIETPRPVMLPAGDHPVRSARRQTLPVGHYPGVSGTPGREGQDGWPASRCRDCQVPHDGREGIGRQSGGASAQRRVAGAVRDGGCDLERHRSGRADPHGDGRAEPTGARGLPGTLAGCAATASCGEPRAVYPSRDAERGAVSGYAARHGDFETGGLVNGFIDAMAPNQRMTRMENPELQDLVDAPRERLDVEYKAWLDLDDKAMQAKLAKHLCALANHGSGYVVFGIADDMTSAGEPPAQAAPTVGTAVRDREELPDPRPSKSRLRGEISQNGRCPSSRLGPLARSGTGVQQTRGRTTAASRWGSSRAPTTPGSPACIDYAGALEADGVAFAMTAGHCSTVSSRCCGRRGSQPGDALQRWHEAAHRKFLEVVDGDPDADLLKRANYQLSYRIGLAGGEPLGMGGLVDELRKMGNDVRQFVNSGLPMFEIAYSSDFMPHSTFDPRLGEDEFLECNPVNADGRHLMLWDFWRVSPVGMGTIVRAYEEDRFHGWSSTAGPAPGTWFWLRGMAREIAEMIRHARAFAERFEAPETLSIRAEWLGLQGRTLGDPENPFVWRRSGTARDDRRVFAKTLPVAGLAEGWPALTAEMLSPVLRLFDVNGSVSAQDVQNWSEKFTR